MLISNEVIRHTAIEPRALLENLHKIIMVDIQVTDESSHLWRK